MRESCRHLSEASVKQCLVGAAALNPLAAWSFVRLCLDSLHIVVVQLFCDVGPLGDLACSPLGLVGQNHSIGEKLIRVIRLIKVLDERIVVV